MKLSQSLTVRGSAPGVLRVLETPCRVSAAFDVAAPGPYPAQVDFVAIWDTGASGTVITQQVITACGLQPVGVTQVHDASGIRSSDVYLINVFLPNGVAVVGVSVTTGILPAGKDVLIGMDIITQGDFSITNKGGNTVFSFRTPSELSTDYVQIHNERIAKEAERKRSRPPKRHK